MWNISHLIGSFDQSYAYTVHFGTAAAVPLFLFALISIVLLPERINKKRHNRMGYTVILLIGSCLKGPPALPQVALRSSFYIYQLIFSQIHIS